MNREEKMIYDALLMETLPPGWQCELAWPYRCHTHLVAPQRKGGVVVANRNVKVQLSGDGTCAEQVEVGDYAGRNWLPNIVEAAVRAAFEYADRFPQGKKSYIVGKLGTHAADRFQVGRSRHRRGVEVGDCIYIRGTDPRVAKWTRVTVDKIKVDAHDLPFYFMSL